MDDFFRGVDLLQNGDGVGTSLSGAVLGPGEDVPSAERHRDGGLLDGRRLVPALLEDAHQQLALQAEVLELVALGVGDVGRLLAGVLRGDLELGLPASSAAARVGPGDCGGGGTSRLLGAERETKIMI